MAFPTTKRVELVGKKKFAATALDPEHEIFIVHIASISSIALPSFSLLKKFAATAFGPRYEIFVIHITSLSSIILSSSSTLKEFAAAVLDPEYATYLVHVGSVNFVVLRSSSPLNDHPSCRPQEAGLIAKETPTKVPHKYANFADVFSLDLASKFPKHTKINDHVINLEEANGFMRLSKSLAIIPFCLSESWTDFFSYVPIIKALITSWSWTNTYYYRLGTH